MITTILAEQAAGAAAAIQKPMTEVTNAFGSQFDNSRALVDAALKWLTENGVSFAVNVLVALLLLAIGSRLIHWVTASARRALHKSKRVNALLETFICSVVNKTGWVLLLMVVIQRLGVNIAPLIAGLGVTALSWASHFRSRSATWRRA
jgi:small-conductance mechanosensitive channel